MSTFGTTHFLCTGLPGSENGVITYGRTFVTIPFYAKQQVVDFVYHCHILEHEDKGMMAVVQVYDPTQLASADAESQFAALIQGSICSLPPATP